MRRRRGSPAALLAVAIAALIVGYFQRDRNVTIPTSTSAPPSVTRTVTVAPETRQAPAEASKASEIPEAERAAVLKTLALIERGGPFPHKQDGTVFANREGRLPQQRRGYYREYTVPTPGSRTRGARRIVRGEGGETYYTNDHYNTFRRIDE